MLIALACAWYSRATGHPETLVGVEVCQALFLPLESCWSSAVAVADPHLSGPWLSCRLAPKLVQMWSQIPNGTRHDAFSSRCGSPGVKHPKCRPQQAQHGVRCTAGAGGRVAGRTEEFPILGGEDEACAVAEATSTALPSVFLDLSAAAAAHSCSATGC